MQFLNLQGKTFYWKEQWSKSHLDSDASSVTRTSTSQRAWALRWVTIWRELGSWSWGPGTELHVELPTEQGVCLKILLLITFEMSVYKHTYEYTTVTGLEITGLIGYFHMYVTEYIIFQ